MAVLLSKYSIFILFILKLGMAPAIADVNKDVEFEKRVVSIAYQDFINSLKVAEGVIDKCEKEGEKIVPSYLKLKDTGASLNELKVAVYYLHRKSRSKCESPYLSEFLVAVTRYRNTVEYYGYGDKEALSYTDDMLYGNSWSEYEIKAKYLNINQVVRNKLEDVESLNRSFNFQKTIDSLNLP